MSESSDDAGGQKDGQKDGRHGDQDGQQPGEEVGSVAEEAVKLLGALSGWARTHGSDMGHGVADAATGLFHELDQHVATGSADCRYCPVCRMVHVVREGSPEVRNHLMVAGANLMQAAAALMATAVPDEKRRQHDDGVERIEFDDEWPEDE